MAPPAERKRVKRANVGDDLIHLVLDLPRSLPPVIGLGAFLKDTITVIDGNKAYVTRDIGHTDTPGAIEAMQETAWALISQLEVVPAAVAHDLHPDFPTTRFAAVLAEDLCAERIPVQHHHAHVAAVAAENGHEAPVLGLSFDGFGLGPCNEAWGGELLFVDGGHYFRAGHLCPLLQPGGDVAAREVWRMGAAALHAIGRGDEIARRWPHLAGASKLSLVMEKGLNCPQTTSMGRLFDAAAGLLGVCDVAEREGQAPIALEALVSEPKELPTGWRISGEGELDLRPLLTALADVTDPQEGANIFHGTLAAAIAEWVVVTMHRLPAPVTGIVYSGGCFFNKVLTRDLSYRLGAQGVQILKSDRLGPGDPAISLGQAYAAAQLLDETI
ncbi:carbamoyltransferase HypF [Breoghania sp. JC706]|uniref:Kae1-like domain-containing protein n=1 Tax=Breoghania sp. JC706 TaxID=3117732 RepID=UPI00300987F5